MAAKSSLDDGPPDHVSRVKASSPFGTAVFVGLRAADVFAQHALFARHLAPVALAAVGLSSIDPVSGGSGSGSVVGGAATAVALGLPLWPLTLVGMAGGIALKQVHVLLFLSEQEMPAPLSVIVGLANVLTDSINAFIFCSAYLSPASASASGPAATPATTTAGLLNAPTPAFWAGCGLYATGLFLEWYSELQRKSFKSKEENRGKPFTGGLFGLARHINYGGYTIARAGYSMAAGGWVWGAVTGAILLTDFATRAVPALDHYCSKRYGTEWIAFKKRTTTKMIPGIY